MPSRVSLRSFHGFAAFFLSFVLGTIFVSNLDAQDNSTVGHLRLVNGDFARGALAGCTKPNHIDWQCEEFDRPLVIDVNQLQRLETGIMLAAKTDNKSLLFNINGSDSINGSMIAADEQNITIRNAILGDLTIPVAQLSQIRRVETPHDLLFNGMASEPSIRAIAEKQGWQFNGRALVASKTSERLACDVHLAPQSRMDIRMSWEGQPQFDIALGVDSRTSSKSEAPHIEVWDRGLVLVHQVQRQADATFLRELGENETDIALTIYFDQTNGLVAVFSSSGALLGKIQLADKPATFHPNVAFVNHGSSWSLDAVNVSKWNGSLPYPYGDASSETQQVRREVTGKLKGYDAQSAIFTLESKTAEEVTVPLEELATFIAMDSSLQKASQTGDAGLPRVQVMLSDGSYVSGELAASEPGFLRIRSKYAEDAFVSPVSQVLSIRKLSDAVTALPAASKRMRLKMDGIEISGQLMEMSKSHPNAMLCFQPSFSDESIGIRDTAHGTIGPSRANTTAPSVKSDQIIRGNVRIFLPAQIRQAEVEEQVIASVFRTPRGMQLRSGDLLDASIESIDDTGVRFHSTSTSCTFLPHEAIQSAEIKIPLRGLPIDVKKMERLLTVPRMKRDNPPTHLIVMSNGDYLRGRLLRLTEEFAEFEEGNSPIKIPRAAVAVIIWLHDRRWEKANEEDEAETEMDAFQVHIRLRSTGRFTFRPDRIDKEKIYGDSPFIGPVNCSLSNIESLEFGKDIVSHIAKREENAWQLQLAKSPAVFEENDPNGLPMAEQLGTSSSLVGKTAPNFEIKSIAGQPWRLGNQLGKVIVLDFWASWCGPCMHAMPQVERIVTDLDRDDVLWVGVNIQESAQRAQSAIDRLRIQSLVLLDQDGGVGTEYDARAIPLTVIIDREGLVRHVFVGGGEETLAGIEKAIAAIVEKANDATQ